MIIDVEVAVKRSHLWLAVCCSQMWLTYHVIWLTVRNHMLFGLFNAGKNFDSRLAVLCYPLDSEVIILLVCFRLIMYSTYIVISDPEVSVVSVRWAQAQRNPRPPSAGVLTFRFLHSLIRISVLPLSWPPDRLEPVRRDRKFSRFNIVQPTFLPLLLLPGCLFPEFIHCRDLRPLCALFAGSIDLFSLVPTSYDLGRPPIPTNSHITN
jgi:hypothetical protein